MVFCLAFPIVKKINTKSTIELNRHFSPSSSRGTRIRVIHCVTHRENLRYGTLVIKFTLWNSSLVQFIRLRSVLSQYKYEIPWMKMWYICFIIIHFIFLYFDFTILTWVYILFNDTRSLCWKDGLPWLSRAHDVTPRSLSVVEFKPRPLHYL